MTFTWWQGEVPVGSGSTLSVNLPAGVHSFRLVVSDAAGSSAEDVWVTIADTTAPLIHASASLLPARGKMVPVVIQAEVLDLCDPFASARIVAVESDEASDRANWEITGPLTLNVRARSRPGQGTDVLHHG